MKKTVIESIVRDLYPDASNTVVSMIAAQMNICGAIGADLGKKRHQFKITRGGKSISMQITLEPIKEQYEGKPWMFLADMQTGMFSLKTGTCWCENGKLNFYFSKGNERFDIEPALSVETVLYSTKNDEIIAREAAADRMFPEVLVNTKKAIGLTNPECSSASRVVNLNGETIEVFMYPVEMPNQRDWMMNTPWRFKCTIRNSTGNLSHGAFWLQYGKIYTDVPGYGVFHFDQIVQVETSNYPA